MVAGYKALRVYQMAYESSMEVFRLTKKFPDDEKYCLTKQIRNSSRSVSANIAEGYRKRRYPKHFISKLSDSDGETSETIVWLDYAYDCGYIDINQKIELQNKYDQIGRMLGTMIQHPERFKPRKQI